MKSIIHDIESQLDAIVNVIPEDQFRKCINEYQRSLESYRQTAAGQQTFIRNTSDPEINSLRDKLVEFQAAAQNIIGKEESGARAIAGGVFSFDGSANTQPLKSAFRNLFDSGQQESDQEVFTHQSPQFKVIWAAVGLDLDDTLFIWIADSAVTFWLLIESVVWFFNSSPICDGIPLA